MANISTMKWEYNDLYCFDHLSTHHQNIIGFIVGKRYSSSISKLHLHPCPSNSTPSISAISFVSPIPIHICHPNCVTHRPSIFPIRNSLFYVNTKKSNIVGRGGQISSPKKYTLGLASSTLQIFKTQK